MSVIDDDGNVLLSEADVRGTLDTPFSRSLGLSAANDSARVQELLRGRPLVASACAALLRNDATWDFAGALEFSSYSSLRGVPRLLDPQAARVFACFLARNGSCIELK